MDKVEELALRRILRPLFLNNCSPGMPHNTIHQLYFRLSALLQLFGSEESLTHRVMLLLGAPINVRVPGEPNPAGAEPIAEGQGKFKFKFSIKMPKLQNLWITIASSRSQSMTNQVRPSTWASCRCCPSSCCNVPPTTLNLRHCVGPSWRCSTFLRC